MIVTASKRSPAGSAAGSPTGSPTGRWIARGLLAAAFLLVCTSAPLARALVWSLESWYPDPGIRSVPHAQAIVLLGGSYHPAIFDPYPEDRLPHAARLYQAGKAPLILCAGHGTGSSEAEEMRDRLLEWKIPPESVLLENHSLTTHENGLFAVPILNARGIRRILLVTSAVHMPRAAAVFRRQGLDVIPAPTVFRRMGNPGGTWLANRSDLRWAREALHEWAGLLVYRIRGWI